MVKTELLPHFSPYVGSESSQKSSATAGASGCSAAPAGAPNENVTFEALYGGGGAQAGTRDVSHNVVALSAGAGLQTWSVRSQQFPVKFDHVTSPQEGEALQRAAHLERDVTWPRHLHRGSLPLQVMPQPSTAFVFGKLTQLAAIAAWKSAANINIVRKTRNCASKTQKIGSSREKSVPRPTIAIL